MKMQRKDTHYASFTTVRDKNKRKIAGLYLRNDRFYSQLWVTDPDTLKKSARKFPLLTPEGTPCRTVTEARESQERLRVKRQEETLPLAGRKPSFRTWADEYLALTQTLAKKAGTLENEKQSIERWKAHFDCPRVDKITTPLISAFKEKRLNGGKFGAKKFSAASPRTVRLDFIMLRNVLNAAKEAGHIRQLPEFPKLKVSAPERRSLISATEFERLLGACTARREGTNEPVTKNGEQLQDFLQFLAFTGCREQEGIKVRWSHVDFENKRVFVGAPEGFEASAMTIGTGGTSKNHGSRIVDFNPQLENLLLEMKERKQESSSWLFPSPQRGEKDIHAKTFRESLKLVRAHAKLPEVGFHDLRHRFCSFCVMAGIDFMTIAAWLGHKDGGILIGKVYGHLLDEHRKKMAAKLTIGLSVVPKEAVSA
jgi:integrase